jgi:hypothetical protein
VGGKAGGKGPTSIGNGTNTDKVEEAISLAADYQISIRISNILLFAFPNSNMGKTYVACYSPERCNIKY